MSDNEPSSARGTQWRMQRWKNRQATLLNNNATGSEPHYNGADRSPPPFLTIKVNLQPQVPSGPVSEGSSSQATAVVPQLHQTGGTSVVMHERTGLNKDQATMQYTSDNSTHQDTYKPHHNGAFNLSRTVEFHPHLSSHHSEGSSSQSTASIHPQVSTCSKTQPDCEPTTSTHRPHPLNVQSSSTDSKTHISWTVAGPTKQSSVQRTASTGIPSKYMAIDCEMVGAGPKGQINQLARCSIVSYDGDVVYDKFIKPPLAITDYRTRWSGIRPYNLYRATPYDEARKEILKLVKGKVLIGHAIHNDLKVLSYCHPKDLTRDTARIPLLNVKAGFNEKEMVSLKRLTKVLLNRDIQFRKTGHSSVEDAKATMELYKLIEVEWERTLASKAKHH